MTCRTAAPRARPTTGPFGRVPHRSRSRDASDRAGDDATDHATEHDGPRLGPQEAGPLPHRRAEHGEHRERHERTTALRRTDDDQACIGGGEQQPERQGEGRQPGQAAGGEAGRREDGGSVMSLTSTPGGTAGFAQMTAATYLGLLVRTSSVSTAGTPVAEAG